MLLNKSLNLATLLYDEKQAEEENRTKLGIVQVPSLLERFIILPSEGQKHKFILLEDVISSFTHKLFTDIQYHLLLVSVLHAMQI